MVGATLSESGLGHGEEDRGGAGKARKTEKSSPSHVRPGTGEVEERGKEMGNEASGKEAEAAPPAGRGRGRGRYVLLLPFLMTARWLLESRAGPPKTRRGSARGTCAHQRLPCPNPVVTPTSSVHTGASSTVSLRPWGTQEHPFLRDLSSKDRHRDQGSPKAGGERWHRKWAKNPRCREVNNLPDMQRVRLTIRILMRDLLCRHRLYYSGTQRGGSRRMNTLTSPPPSHLPVPPEQKPEGTGAPYGAHPAASTQVGLRRGTPITPTAGTSVGPWASLPPLCKATGLGSASRGHLLLLQDTTHASALPPARAGPAASRSPIPSSFTLPALPSFHHRQKPQNGLLLARQAIGSGYPESRGPADATGAQAAHSSALARPSRSPCQPCSRRPGGGR